MIQFACTCGTQLQLPSVLAGESGRCPKCRRTLKAPLRAGQVRWDEVDRGGAAEEGVRIIEVARDPMATRTREILAFPCPICTEPLRIKVSYAGKPGRCSHCSATFAIPDRPAPDLSGSRKGWGGATKGKPQPKPRPEPEPPKPEPPPPPPSASGTRIQPSRPLPTRHGPPRSIARRTPAPPPRGREAFRVVSVTCVCGRKVKAPLVRLRAGESRCPSCDELLQEN